MSSRTLGNILLYLAALIATIGAMGHMFTSIPAISGHFHYETDIYWRNRLLASLILGSVGLYFGTLILWIGTWLFSQKDAGKQFSGKILLLIGILPHIANFITLPTLTPQDWPHMITHGLIIVCIPLGLYLAQKKRT